MEAHHRRAVDAAVARLSAEPGVEAILLAGSLAHGYAGPGSDVDLIVVAAPAEHERRRREGRLTFALTDICDYAGGYIDCKVVARESLRLIAERGSDPARYAFKDAAVLSGGDPELAALLAAVARFPLERQAERRHRFACQALAWKWYLSQAEEKGNAYLRHLAAHKVILFACRLVLNRNRLLYPYHKWLLRETAGAAERPAGFMEAVEAFAAAPAFAGAQAICDGVLALEGLAERGLDWPNQFMADSELNWVDHEAPVDDL